VALIYGRSPKLKAQSAIVPVLVDPDPPELQGILNRKQHRVAVERKKTHLSLYITLVLAPLGCIFISLCVGRYPIAFSDVIKILISGPWSDMPAGQEIIRNIIWGMSTRSFKIKIQWFMVVRCGSYLTEQYTFFFNPV